MEPIDPATVTPLKELSYPDALKLLEPILESTELSLGEPRFVKVYDLNTFNSNQKEYNAPVFLPGKSHGLRSLEGYSLWDCKESDMSEQLHFTCKEAVFSPVVNCPQSKLWTNI